MLPSSAQSRTLIKKTLKVFKTTLEILLRRCRISMLAIYSQPLQISLLLITVEKLSLLSGSNFPHCGWSVPYSTHSIYLAPCEQEPVWQCTDSGEIAGTKSALLTPLILKVQTVLSYPSMFHYSQKQWGSAAAVFLQPLKSNSWFKVGHKMEIVCNVGTMLCIL